MNDALARTPPRGARRYPAARSRLVDNQGSLLVRTTTTGPPLPTGGGGPPLTPVARSPQVFNMGLFKDLFGPPPPGMGGRAIVRPRAAQGPENDDPLSQRMNQLETRVERLEMDQAERQLAVLSALEKVLHQLRARERKRAREDEGEQLDDEPTVPVAGNGGHYPNTAALARRFRRW